MRRHQSGPVSDEGVTGGRRQELVHLIQIIVALRYTYDGAAIRAVDRRGEGDLAHTGRG